MKQLNSQQRDELIEQYVEIVVDNLDRDHLAQIVTDSLTDHYGRVSDSELKEIESLYDAELYDELVDNVKNETVLDINNTGGKY